MLDERAYQHWYSRYGVEDEDFQAAVESIRRVSEEYKLLAASDPAACTKLSAAQRRIRDA
jgi:ribonucleotide reductase alpha subunit